MGHTKVKNHAAATQCRRTAVCGKQFAERAEGEQPSGVDDGDAIAVWPEQAQHFALANREGKAVHGHDPAERLSDVNQVQHAGSPRRFKTTIHSEGSAILADRRHLGLERSEPSS